MANELEDMVVDVTAISESMDDLTALYREVASARETYNEAIDAVAIKANVSKVVLRQLVKAHADNTEREVTVRSTALVELIEALSLE
jgi:methyl-accepting chemotaxis protein